MIVKAIKTRPLIPPQDNLLSALKESFLGFQFKENSIIAVTSKVVSIWEGNCIKMDGKINKDEIVKGQADFYLDRKEVPKGYVVLTIKDNILIPSAGIDESNANGHYILWPKNPLLSAKKIHKFFAKEYKIKNLGVIITDSHCVPQRSGTMGIALAYYGFLPVKDYRGKKDIFGREMKVSISNMADSLAVSAVLVMGEGSEQTPVAVIENINFIQFKKDNNKRKDLLKIAPENDIYFPVLKNIKWKKGGNSI